MITESSATRRGRDVVMVRGSAPCTACDAGLKKGMDGQPPPTMTASRDRAALAAIIPRQAVWPEPAMKPPIDSHAPRMP